MNTYRNTVLVFNQPSRPSQSGSPPWVSVVMYVIIATAVEEMLSAV